MKIDNIIENNDGTCTLECTFTDEEIQILVEKAVTDLLKEYIETHGKDNE